MASDRKITEGQEHIKNAEKSLKTGFLKWKPDYDTAVSEYTKAAVCFKNAKAHELCIDTYVKAADAQEKQGSAFHAAKSLESAALICKELKQFERVAQLVQKASDLYLEHGTPDTAAIALDKAAKMVEPTLPERAIEMYLKAVNIGEAEGRPRQCAESTGKIARLYIRLKRLDEAAATLNKEIENYLQVENHGLVNKLIMGLVLVHLHLGDSVAAQKAFQSALQYPGFVESEEAGPVQSLIEAFDQGDQELAQQIASSPLFRYMENDFTKLARDLKVPGGKRKAPAAAASETEASVIDPGDNSLATGNTAEDDSDEEMDLK